MKHKQILFLAILFLTISFSVKVYAQTSQCLGISSNLSYGMTDSASNGPIFELQNFLVARGYMSVTPNGHFGPATLSAVEAFQSAENINSTGYVGPLTRVAIQNFSCFPNTNSSSNQNTVQTTPTTVSSSSSSNQGQVTAPASGETLTIGKSYNIAWTNQPQSDYSIILETPGGVGEGFIASNISGGTNYSWTVGNVFSNGSQTEQVSPGSYRIHIENSTSGVSNSDQYSGTFNIVPPNLSVSSFFPTTISNSGNSSVAIVGSGFDPSTIIYFDTGVQADKLFVSPDGTILVFSVPSTVISGMHQISVSNEYQSNVYVGTIDVIQDTQ